MSELLTPRPIQASASNAKQVVETLLGFVAADDVVALSSNLMLSNTYDNLAWLISYSDEPQLDLLNKLAACLDDRRGQMKNRSVELAEARLQMLRLYRRMDLQSLRQVKWVLSAEGSLPRTLRTLALWATPLTVFH